MMGSQKTTLRLAPIPPRVHNLLSQLAFRPRRLASRVPLAQRAQRLVVREIKSAHDATAHTKCPQIALLSGDSGIDALEKCARAIHRSCGRQRSPRAPLAATSGAYDRITSVLAIIWPECGLRYSWPLSVGRGVKLEDVR